MKTIKQELFIGNVYGLEKNKSILNEIVEVFTDETSDTIASAYVLVKEVIKRNDLKVTVKGYDVSKLIND